MSNHLTLKPEGLYCAEIGAYIDPVRRVEKAIITHGHADHARSGHGAVLATQQTLDIMAIRYGPKFCGSAQSISYGETLTLGGVDVSLHPAGHVLGSAQVLLSSEGHRTVVSGDYKRQDDPTCQPFELVPCDTFITEATFGLPIFRHPPVREEVGKLLASQEIFPDRTHLVGAYSLGKAQRVIGELRAAGYGKPIYLHEALEQLTGYYQSQGIELGALEAVGDDCGKLPGEIVICPPGSLNDGWAARFDDPRRAMASGWLRVRGRSRLRGVELPLVLSDHADWDELCRTIIETGAEQIWVTHGAEEALVHWCKLNGRTARPLSMMGRVATEEAAL